MASENTSKLAWLFAGAAIGATIALLYAPTSGAETRGKIGRRTEKGRDALADSSRDLLDKGRHIADEAAEMFDRGRKLVEG